VIETIKSYLVSLGFKVDNTSYQAATKAMGNAEQSVAKFAGGAVTSFAIAGAAVVSFVGAASIGIAKFVGELAQADLETEKLARKLWLGKDAAASYNNTLKAMGVTLEDLYLSPELMKNFQTLNQESKNLRPPTEFAEQMKLVRSVQFEFTRLKLEATYALQWIGYYFMKYMEGPIKQIKQTLSEINGIIVKTMPSWTKVIAQVMSWFARMGITTFRVFKDIIRIFNDLGSAIPRNLKLIGAAIGALAIIIQTGPLGIITATLTALILLLDDFYTYLDGGESAFGPFWQKLIDFYDSLKGSGVFEDFKKGWKDAVETISELLDNAKKEIADFYSNLENKGAIDNFKSSFSNTFEIIQKLLSGAKTWVQDLYKELEKQGVLKDLKKSFEDVVTSVSNLTAAVTKAFNKLLGLKETETVLNGIGKILRDVILVSLKSISEILDGFAGFFNVIASFFRGDILEKTQKAGEEAKKRLDENPDLKNEGYWESLWKTTTGFFTDWKNPEFSDKVTRALGLIAEAMARNKKDKENMTNPEVAGTPGGSPAYSLPTPNYIYPQSTTNTNNNTSIQSSPTYNIYSSDAKSGMEAAQSNYDAMLTRNLSGVVR